MMQSLFFSHVSRIKRDDRRVGNADFTTQEADGREWKYGLGIDRIRKQDATRCRNTFFLKMLHHFLGNRRHLVTSLQNELFYCNSAFVNRPGSHQTESKRSINLEVLHVQPS